MWLDRVNNNKGKFYRKIIRSGTLEKKIFRIFEFRFITNFINLKYKTLKIKFFQKNMNKYCEFKKFHKI